MRLADAAPTPFPVRPPQAQQLPPNQAACYSLGSWAGGKQVSISLYSARPAIHRPRHPAEHERLGSLHPMAAAPGMPILFLRPPDDGGLRPRPVRVMAPVSITAPAPRNRSFADPEDPTMGVVYTMRGGDSKGCIGRNTCASPRPRVAAQRLTRPYGRTLPAALLGGHPQWRSCPGGGLPQPAPARRILNPTRPAPLPQ